jgi:hypothetical protein
MKNEVKKKMHELQLASLHQSHRKTGVKTKISTALRENTSRRSQSQPRRCHAESRVRIDSLHAKQRTATPPAPPAFIVFDHFPSPRIYNDSCEIFAGA